MTEINPLGCYQEVIEAFPGIDRFEPDAVGSLVLRAAAYEYPYDFINIQDPDQSIDVSWYRTVYGILRDLEEWKVTYPDRSPESFTEHYLGRLEAEKEAQELAAQLEILPTEEAYKSALEFAISRGYGVTEDLEPSPLFPDGRTIFKPLETLIDLKSGRVYLESQHALKTRDGDFLNDEIEDFITKGYWKKRSSEMVNEVLESLQPLTAAELEQLTLRYGAKGAALLSFEKRIDELNNGLREAEVGIMLSIPPFTAVSVDLYKAWQDDEGLFEEMLEIVRQEAIVLSHVDRYHTPSAGLVAVRSSAVFSEDGEHSTGAGIYSSVAVNPDDIEAFKSAVVEVFKSVNSLGAVSYREHLGIPTELMGLIIQTYLEKVRSTWGDYYWGSANSRGANPNLMDINTNRGTLLYDRNFFKDKLLLERHYKTDEDNGLHTYPDHDNKLHGAIGRTKEIPHALLLAEKVFGKPMQIEFVNDQIVQVRPIVNLEAYEPIDFPDEDCLMEASAVGVGDMVLEYLDRQDDNSEKEGYIIFTKENAYTIQGSIAAFNGERFMGDYAFPRRGAVIIINPSDSGHIQAICREKGLLCVYPKKSDRNSSDFYDVLYQTDEQSFRRGPKEERLRFVADGYEARLYPVKEAEA